MDNFRLKVFRSAARNLSFTKAASELFISQPSVTKHVQSLERALGLRLFMRTGSRITLTPAGKVLLDYSDKLFALQLKLEDDLNIFKESKTGTLRLGASSTIAQYVIPPVLSKFHRKYPGIYLTLLTGNSEQVIDALLKGEIDLGIVEGRVKNSDIKYIKFITDELAAVTNSKNNLLNKNEITLKELACFPLVLRERGSGTLEVLEHSFKSKGIKLASLNVVMYLGSTESIKLFLETDDSIGFISIRALKKELNGNSLKIIKVKDFHIKRTFNFITLHGSDPTNAAAKFIKFARNLHNQK